MIGEPSDHLTRRVEQILTAAGRPTMRISEQQLHEDTELVFERQGTEISGYLRYASTQVLLNSLAGVLARMPLRWHPDVGYAAQDRTFVYHESTAAWIALLSALPCRVINRFGLDWWLREPSGVGSELELARRLGWPNTSPDSGVERIHVVDGRLIDGSASARAKLEPHREVLAAWQRESGLHLCGLDLVGVDHPALAAIDPLPWIDDAGELEAVARATTEALS